jgi:hypothetical protein
MTQGKSPPQESDAMLQALAEWPERATGGKSAAEWDDAAEQVSARIAAGAKPRSSLGVSDEEIFRAPLPQTKTEEESARDFVTKKDGGKQQRGRDRQSLKDLAKMANVTPGAPPVAAEAPAEDSGIIDMGVLTSMPSTFQMTERAAAPAPPPPVSSKPFVPAATPAPRPKPVLPPELMPAAALEPARAAPVQAMAAPPAETKQRGGGTWALFGALAVAAAAVGVYLGVRGGVVGASVATAPATTAPSTSSGQVPAKLTAAASGVPASATAAPSAIPVTSLAMADTPRAQPPLSGGPAVGAGKGGAPALAPSPLIPADPKPVTPASTPASKPAAASNDLNSLMAQAVGATPTATPTPAAANNDTSQAAGSVPLKPSLGAIQGALGAALPGARGCLGADDAVSRATVTFKSDGSVQSVAVKGGAAGTPAEGCIRSALMKAHVPPFAEASFASPVTIRPN